MTDVALAEPKSVTFSDLVREAFIDPLRSVLIIDDKYPTWEQIFGEEGYDPADGDGKRWVQKEKILEVIRQFRKLSPALTVDIHDGTNNKQIETYLHQSDLLVLDYQLEPEPSPGKRCAAIIKYLLDNNHFNLVVVHTMIDDLTEPFYKILLSLLCPLGFAAENVNQGEERIEEQLSIDGNFHNRIEAAIPLAAYVALRAHIFSGGEIPDFVLDAVELAAFRIISDTVGWNEEQRLAVVEWAMSRHDERAGGNSNDPRDLRWRVPQSGKPSWIRSSGAFIAFAAKTTADLLNVVQAAIQDWKPSPSRLMSARLRAEISQKGVGAEDNALSDKFAYWHYYQELRSKPKDASQLAVNSHRNTMLEGHAARHVERLFDQISKKSVEFGVRVLEADPVNDGGDPSSFADHYGINSKNNDNKKRALAHYNAHISTKLVSGWHLQPGHIFKIDEVFWICLSQSCDLVPLQKPELGIENSSAVSMMPFLAVKLDEKPKYKPKDINSNTLIFLRQGDEVKIYSLFPGGDTTASPIWRLFTASDHGKFVVADDRVADFEVHYMSGGNDELAVKSTKARIIGQLRYEYALNLIQKLGAVHTRVGLDFSVPR